MTTLVYKDFHFSAAHSLPIPGHPCSVVHGHNFRVRVVCSGPLDSNGMVLDFDVIRKAMEPIVAELDHSNLNEKIAGPTSERIAAWIVDALRDRGFPMNMLSEVHVMETDTCGAIVRVS